MSAELIKDPSLNALAPYFYLLPYEVKLAKQTSRVEVIAQGIASEPLTFNQKRALLAGLFYLLPDKTTCWRTIEGFGLCDLLLPGCAATLKNKDLKSVPVDKLLPHSRPSDQQVPTVGSKRDLQDGFSVQEGKRVPSIELLHQDGSMDIDSDPSSIEVSNHSKPLELKETGTDAFVLSEGSAVSTQCEWTEFLTPKKTSSFGVQVGSSFTNCLKRKKKKVLVGHDGEHLPQAKALSKDQAAVQLQQRLDEATKLKEKRLPKTYAEAVGDKTKVVEKAGVTSSSTGKAVEDRPPPVDVKKDGNRSSGDSFRPSGPSTSRSSGQRSSGRREGTNKSATTQDCSTFATDAGKLSPEGKRSNMLPNGYRKPVTQLSRYQGIRVFEVARSLKATPDVLYLHYQSGRIIRLEL
jgi:hypothetical protein